MRYDVTRGEAVVDGLIGEKMPKALLQDNDPRLERWPVPDPEDQAILIAAAAMARRTLGAPIAAAALVGRQSGVILPAGAGPRRALSIDDPLLRVLRGTDDAVALVDASADPRMAGSALCGAGIGARSMLVAPIRLQGGPAIGVLAVAAQCISGVDDVHRLDLTQLAERTAEEVLARHTARTDPATGALSIKGLIAALGREARRRAMHGRPAALAVLVLSRALGAPRAFDPAAYRCAEEQSLAGEAWLVDNDPLPPQILRMAAKQILSVLRESDVLAGAPTPTEDLAMDAALDTPFVPQTEGQTCQALLMPETTAAQALVCVHRIQGWLASVDLPGAPGRHICAIAGVTEIAADATGGKPAAHAALRRAYDAVAAARRDRVSAALTPVPA
jgi:hypothetical protein